MRKLVVSKKELIPNIVNKDFVGIDWGNGNKSMLVVALETKLIKEIMDSLNYQYSAETKSKRDYVLEVYRTNRYSNVYAYKFKSKINLIEWLIT